MDSWTGKLRFVTSTAFPFRPVMLTLDMVLIKEGILSFMFEILLSIAMLDCEREHEGVGELAFCLCLCHCRVCVHVISLSSERTFECST